MPNNFDKIQSEYDDIASFLSENPLRDASTQQTLRNTRNLITQDLVLAMFIKLFGDEAADNLEGIINARKEHSDGTIPKGTPLEVVEEVNGMYQSYYDMIKFLRANPPSTY